MYLLFSLLPFTTFAQGLITNENFETYTAGARLCTQAPDSWFTWNNGAGTAEDPFVTDSLAFESNNSLFVSGSNNVVLDLKGKTSGHYEVSFYVLVPSGKTGFYGLLQKFDGTISDWGIQCFFDVNHQGNIKAAGDVVSFNYNTNQWIPIRNIIDLNNDHAEVYINNILVYEWQWSNGFAGTSGPLKLDALNFFAWNASLRQPSMYIDSILYKELPVPGSPSNLVASVAGDDVSLSWDAPSNGSPLGYKIYRNNVVQASDVTTLSYNDTDVYPGTYSYLVKAMYGSGLSQPAGPADVVIIGGTQRKHVLLEIATGTWCTYCPGSAMAVEDHVSHGDKVAVIEYHDNDNYANTDANHRNTYYKVAGYPTANFDGINTVSGGNMTQSIYPSYQPAYAKSMQKISLFDLNMEVTKTGNSELQVSVTASKLYPYANNNLRLHMVLTETAIQETWQNNMTELNYVCRKMYPDYTGTLADFSSDSVLNFTYTFSIDESYNFNNCALITFLQDNSTKEVLQTENIKFNSLGRDELLEANVSVYPNPTSGEFWLLINSAGTTIYEMELLNNLGAVVYKNNKLEVQGSFKQQFNFSELPAGMYTISLRSASNVIVKRIVITK